MKYILMFLALSGVSGCTYIKHAECVHVNTAGWKSQAGVLGTATIEATTDAAATIPLK